MSDIPHVIEVALLILIVFIIGCFVGALLRKLTLPSNAMDSSASSAKPETVKSPTVSATSKKPAAKTKPASAAKPAARASAAAKAKPAPKSKPAAQKPARKTAKPKVSSAPAAAATDGKPEVLDGPREGGKDDLKRIKGIGPKIEGQLNSLGVFHFDQVARWNKKSIDWVDGYLSFKGRVDREKWVSQAKALAKNS